MKIRLLVLCLLALPVLANAEIYKWKDKDGSTRYSDVPPPSNIKHEPMAGKKAVKPTGQAPLAPVDGDISKSLNRNAKAEAEQAPLSKEEAAAKRARDADAQKKADDAVLAEKKVRAENCKAARSNLATFKNGGRISRTDEKGERELLDDSQIERGKADAQKDIDKYCD